MIFDPGNREAMERIRAYYAQHGTINEQHEELDQRRRLGHWNQSLTKQFPPPQD